MTSILSGLENMDNYTSNLEHGLLSVLDSTIRRLEFTHIKIRKGYETTPSKSSIKMEILVFFLTASDNTHRIKESRQFKLAGKQTITVESFPFSSLSIK